MFTLKTVAPKSALENAIDGILADMAKHKSDSDEYGKMVDQLDKLYKLKAIDKPERVSKDALANVTANLTGIVLILSHERLNVITTKALGFVHKTR